VKKRVLLLAAIVALIASAFVGGYSYGARPAASPSHAYTLRVGDRVTVPAIGEVCVVSITRGIDSNAGPFHPYFFCSGQGYHQVDFFHDRIVVWKTGQSDHPVWSGKS
jgi:hypothetical protein